MSEGSLRDLSFKRLPGEIAETSRPDRGTTSLPCTVSLPAQSVSIQVGAEGPVLQFRRMNLQFSRLADKAHTCAVAPKFIFSSETHFTLHKSLSP